jgi:hypothetical protein
MIFTIQAMKHHEAYNVGPPNVMFVGLDSPQQLSLTVISTINHFVKLELCEPQLHAIVAGGLTLYHC